MLFTTPSFLFAFLPLVVAAYYALPRTCRGLRNVWLLLASFFFYGVGEPSFVIILGASCIVNWMFAMLVKPGRAFRKSFFALALFANLALLVRFKYLAFCISQFNAVCGTSFVVPATTLPLGISFFTFQALSYVIDVFRGESLPRRNPLDVALYIVLFPQLVAGPIVRYNSISEEIGSRRETWSDFSQGLCRFVEGLAKKTLLANQLAIVADSAFDGANWIPVSVHGGPNSVAFAWLGALAFAFQIYFDFSGYSDMAIGMGRMFGFHFQENFLHPYASKTISEFWRRWHISMGTWFRDYVYFPLGGSRVRTRTRLLVNLFVVWALTGLWHGADWTFIIWGLVYFALIVADKFVLGRLFRDGRAAAIISRLWPLFFVVCGWVLFRAQSIRSAACYLGAMFRAHPLPLTDSASMLLLRENALLLFVSAVLSFPVSTALTHFVDETCTTKGARWTRACLQSIWLLALFAASLSFVAKGAHNPFLYFNF